jgi:hypothetical protein
MARKRTRWVVEWEKELAKANEDLREYIKYLFCKMYRTKKEFKQAVELYTDVNWVDDYSKIFNSIWEKLDKAFEDDTTNSSSQILQ